MFTYETLIMGNYKEDNYTNYYTIVMDSRLFISCKTPHPVVYFIFKYLSSTKKKKKKGVYLGLCLGLVTCVIVGNKASH